MSVVLCELGKCSGTDTVKGFQFENKVYPIEDAIKIMRDTFMQTQILSHQNIDGEVSIGFDPQGGYVTFHEGIKAGTKVRLYRDEFLSKGWYSEVDGYCAETCGFIGGSIRREVQIDKFICTKKVRQEEEVCIEEVINSWQQGRLGLGALRGQEDIFLSDEIMYAMIKQNIIGIDRHAWRGDYGSSDYRYKDVDGYIKIAVDAMTSDLPAIMRHTFSGMVAGDHIEGLIGGKLFDVPFNTDIATTLGDFETELESHTDALGKAIFPTVTVNGGSSYIEVTGQVAEQYDLKFAITDGSGIQLCEGGVIEAVVAGTGTVVNQVIQAAKGGNAPIGIDLVNIVPGNVLDRIKELQKQIAAKKPQIKDEAFGANLFVSPNVFEALQMALLEQTEQYTGTCGPMPGCTTVLGFNVVKMNYLPMNEMFYARPDDLHMGTDLLGDVDEIRQGFDPKCGTGWFKQAFSLGFQISETGNVAGTFCNRRQNEFGSLMPCDNQC